MGDTPRILSQKIEPSEGEFFALARRLARTTAAVRESLSAVAALHGLHESQLLLLWQCSVTDGISQRDLAKSLAISPAQISGQVEQLRARGLLTGQRPENDRRRQVWRLTKKGWEILAAAGSSLPSRARWKDINSATLGSLLKNMETVLADSTIPPARRGAA